MLRFVIIRLLIVVYSIRTLSVTVVLAIVIPVFPVILAIAAFLVVIPGFPILAWFPVFAIPVTIPVSVVAVSVSVFVFAAVVTVCFLSVGRFVVSFVTDCCIFRLVIPIAVSFLVSVSVPFLFLLFQGRVEAGDTILSQNILRIAFRRLRLGIGFERNGFRPFLVHIDHIESTVGRDGNQVGSK